MAFLFIPLVAVLLAAFCTVLFVAGKHIYKGVSKANSLATKQLQIAKNSQPAPVVPFVEPKEETDLLPPEVEAEPTYSEVETKEEGATTPEACPAPLVPAKINKPKRQQSPSPYDKGLRIYLDKGLRTCVKEGIFPCAWEDTSYGLSNAGWGKGPDGNLSWKRYMSLVNKQFWLMDKEGPIRRGTYDIKTGDLISETIATVNGTVTQFTLNNVTWYFEGGVLVKIRTSPYENCNFHDWFFINTQGKQDVCQCAYNQVDCCARSPYKPELERSRSYCEIFGQPDEFCN